MRVKCQDRWWMAVLLSVSSLGATGSDIGLVEAVKTANVDIVRALLQKTADVNIPETDGTTALHWAVQRDELTTADLLIRAGANVGAANRYGVTPLSLACTNGSAAMIEMLLKAGADPKTVLPEGETALMTAARTGKADALKVLLAYGAEVNAKESWRGQTALMWAAAERHPAAVRMLLAHGADIHARSKGGFTPLLFAVRVGDVDSIRALVAAGASLNETALDGTSLLMLAIINAHYDLAAFLLDSGLDANVEDPERGSALHALAWVRCHDDRAACHSTLSDIVAPVPTGNLDSLALAKKLLERGANPNKRITWKAAPYSVQNGRVGKMPPTIAVGPQYLSLDGATPFYLATKHADTALMRLLVAHGADPLLPTRQNITPLMAAAGLGFWEGEHPGTESQALAAVKLALELGGDVNAVADFGDSGVSDERWSGSTALHGAAARHANSIVQFLADQGARLDLTTKAGWTPLTIVEGVFYGAQFKENPETAARLRQLMSNAPSRSPQPK